LPGRTVIEQSSDVAIERGDRIEQHPGQVHTDHVLVGLARHLRIGKDLMQLGSADEAAAIAVVEQRLHARDVARAEELALAPVPHE
jgi:hypothetical protein